MFKKVVFLSLLLIATPALAANWTPPSSAAPNCTGDAGCEIPLNVSANGQTKLGPLIVGGLRSLTNLIVDGGPSDFISVILNNNKAIGWKTNTGVISSPIFFAGDNSLRFKTGYGGGGLRVYDGTGANELVRFADSGNVGFGTAVPASRVDVVGDICWTPPAGTRRCLGTFDPGNVGGGGGTSSYWNQVASGDIRNTNANGNVNIQGQIKIEQGAPGNNKILISSNNAGLARWAAASEIPGVTGLGNDVLHTEFGGCLPAVGCTTRVSGDTGPTQRVALLGGGVGSVIMSCPAGYKVVSGGAECDRSFQAGLYAGTLSFLTASRPISETEWEVQCTKYFLSNWSFAQVIINSAEAIRRANITCAK